MCFEYVQFYFIALEEYQGEKRMEVQICETAEESQQ